MKEKLIVLTARTDFKGLGSFNAHSSDVFHGAALLNGQWMCSGFGILWNRKRLESGEPLTYASNEFVPNNRIRYLAGAWILPSLLLERIVEIKTSARPVVVAATYRLDPEAIGEWSDGKRDFALEGQRAVQRAIRPLEESRTSEFVEVSDTNAFGRNPQWATIKYKRSGGGGIETTQVDPEFFHRTGWFVRGVELMFSMEQFRKIEDCVDPKACITSTSSA